MAESQRSLSIVENAQVQTETFTVLAVCQWFNILNCRSERQSIFRTSLLKPPWRIGGMLLGNLLQVMGVFLPFTNDIFHTVPFSLTEVMAIAVTVSLVLWVEEPRELIARGTGRSEALLATSPGTRRAGEQDSA